MYEELSQLNVKFTYFDTDAVQSSIKLHNQSVNIRSFLALNK